MQGKSKLSKLQTSDISNVYIFDESSNPYGTIKDRRNRAIIEEAKRLHVDKLVLITSGNSGYSLSRMAQESHIKVVCVISRRLDSRIKRTLERVAYQVIELNLDQKILRPEELITIARETDEEVIWDVTNGYEDSYIEIVKEISKEIKPQYIVAPVGSGGIFMGLVEGVRRYLPETKVIGIGATEAYQSYADKLSTPWSPYARAMENAAISGHAIFRLSESDIRKVFAQFKNYGNFEPSSAIVFGVFDNLCFKPDDVIVLVNSGRLVLA